MTPSLHVVVRLGLVPGLAALVVACSASSQKTDSSSSPKVASDDERGTVGVPNPADEYCVASGGAVVVPDGGTSGSACAFTDGTSCEPFAFYRGACGKEHSYCAQHGGAVETAEMDAGTWTMVVAVCHLDGVTCVEADFAKTGVCKP